ncbi:MAG TPA: glycosyl hydrolase family 18 protein [Longimicrobiaceae bacterium]|nr:glycosyl hydrolase family 18 protein [Longimicrobiaceae bacterium]
MGPIPNVTLYVGGGDTGLDANWADASPGERATIQRQIENTVTELAGLDWNVCILAFLHVHARTLPMELFFNGTPFGKLYPGLGQQLARLKASGKRLLISIGGWYNACDFSGIQTAGVAEFLARMRQQVITPLGLDGIDLDLEPTPDDQYYCPPEPDWNDVYQKYSPVLVELTNQAAAAGLLVTHAPALYMRPGFYTDRGGILDRTSLRPKGNNIAWLNFQTYDKGEQLPERYEAFVDAIETGYTGIANPAGFVSAGFGIADDLYDDPEVARQAIQQLRAKYGGINGGFVWRYTSDRAQIAQWATALSQALGPG